VEKLQIVARGGIVGSPVGREMCPYRRSSFPERRTCGVHRAGRPANTGSRQRAASQDRTVANWGIGSFKSWKLGAVVALICGCSAGSAGAQVNTYQQTLGVTGTSGSDNGHFNQPTGIGVDSVNGHILISGSGNARVQVYDSGSLAYITTLGVTGSTGSGYPVR
jgi:hypothetical protein